jgi:hypothetical protein
MLPIGNKKTRRVAAPDGSRKKETTYLCADYDLGALLAETVNSHLGNMNFCVSFVVIVDESKTGSLNPLAANSSPLYVLHGVDYVLQRAAKVIAHVEGMAGENRDIDASLLAFDCDGKSRSIAGLECVNRCVALPALSLLVTLPPMHPSLIGKARGNCGDNESHACRL